MKKTFLISIVLIIYSSSLYAQKESSLENEINKIILETDAIMPFNGVLAILQRNKEPVIFYHGYKHPLIKETELDSNDYFYLASNSKLFTGLATLKMLEDYNLNYSDPIGPYFSELNANLKKVTIQQLANHTCAIHDYFSLVDEPFEITNEQALDLIFELDSTVYVPGAKWGYTNSGYILLSELIERVTQMPYNDYLNREILLTLGIDNAQLNPNVSDVLNGYINSEPSKMLSVTTGDAGIYLRTGDLIRFFEHQEKITKYIKQAYNWSSPWKENDWRYGFGWFFSEDSLGKFRAHSGKSSGFESYIRVYESNDIMFFILSNNVNGSARILRDKVIQEIIKRKTEYNKK